MPTNIAQLEAIIVDTLAELAAIASTGTGAGGPPDGSGSDMVQHTAYEDKLWRRIDHTEARIAALQGAFEVTSEMRG